MAARIQLSWPGLTSPAPDSYNLYKGTTQGSETLLALGLTGTSYTDYAIAPGHTYYYYVTAVYSGVESAASNETGVLFPMEKHIFSTAVIAAALSLPITSASVQVGSTSNTVTTLVTDHDLTTHITISTLGGTTGAPQAGDTWQIIDLGSAKLVGSVSLGGVGCDIANQTIGVWGATISGKVPGASGTTAFGAAVVPAALPLTGPLLFTAPASTTARYILIAIANAVSTASTAQIAEVGVSMPSIPIGVIQSSTLDHMFTRAELFDTAQNSVFAVDNADHEGAPSLKISSADMRAEGMQMLAGAILSTLSGPTRTLATMPKTLTLPPLQVTALVLGTDGKTRTIYMPYCKAKGQSIAFKLKDFAMQDATLYFYPDPVTGVVYTVTDAP